MKTRLIIITLAALLCPCGLKADNLQADKRRLLELEEANDALLKKIEDRMTKMEKLSAEIKVLPDAESRRVAKELMALLTASQRDLLAKVKDGQLEMLQRVLEALQKLLQAQNGKKP